MLDLAEPVDTRRQQVPRSPHSYGAAQNVTGSVPAQGAVDRTQPLERTMVDVQIMTPDGTVIQILRNPEFGDFGPDPMDPAGFAPGVDPRTAICAVLAPYAARRCGGMGFW